MTSAEVQSTTFDASVLGVDEVGANGVLFQRHTWLRMLERRLPRHASANVTVRTLTLPPGAATTWRIVNGVSYSMVLAGEAVVSWTEGDDVRTAAGSGFTLDIGRVHRISNGSADRALILITLHITAPDRAHVVPVVPPPAAG